MWTHTRARLAVNSIEIQEVTNLLRSAREKKLAYYQYKFFKAMTSLLCSFLYMAEQCMLYMDIN